MERLTSLPNIGEVLASRLAGTGITTPEQLRELGSEYAFIRILSYDPDACLHELMALEGAVRGVRWHSLEQNIKEELKEVYRQCKVMSRNS